MVFCWLGDSGPLLNDYWDCVANANVQDLVPFPLESLLLFFCCCCSIAIYYLPYSSDTEVKLCNWSNIFVRLIV